MCHGNSGLTMQKGGRTQSIFVAKELMEGSVHRRLSCTSCHAGLNGLKIPHAEVIRPVDCGQCHKIEGFERSVHGGAGGKKPAAACSSCHGTHAIKPADKSNASTLCAKCHLTEGRRFAGSAHNFARAAGDPKAPGCTDCHGAHNADSPKTPTSALYRTREAALCLKCHLDPGGGNRIGDAAGHIAGYKTSVHASALASGNLAAATCSDCHGAHESKKGSDPASHVNRANVAGTCARCHAGVAAEYSGSIHSVALKNGNADSPTCTSCHGDHSIYAPRDARSRVAPRNVSVQVCGSCHNSLPLNQKYGLPSEQFSSFWDSYHGLAARAGDVTVANCASCHGIHNIKPSTDPTSTVHKANLPKTCGSCHPGAGENFARGAVHVIATRETGGILYWISALYLGLIAIVIGSMFLHNVLDFVKKTRRRFALRRGIIPPEAHGSAQYLRLNLNERIQHLLIFISFTLLAVTGFMLRYPEAWWVVPIRRLSDSFFAIRSLVHRVAGGAMIALSVYHFLYVLFARRGRQFLRDVSPRWQDVRDLGTNLRYLTGLSKERARFGRYGYVEKAEYWALVWGVAVMAATGIVMWFENYFIEVFTKLGWDVSRTIHYYEACLAVLAIIVWHFYFTILNPSVFPMATSWITGRITEEEMAEDHPLELERIRAQQKLQE